MHASFLLVADEEKSLLENEIRSAAHRYTLEAITSNALTKLTLAMYWEPDVKKFILLLDNRKIFTSDKAKVTTNPLGFAPSGRLRRRIEESKESSGIALTTLLSSTNPILKK